MLIKNYPLDVDKHGIARPVLQIQIMNPDNHKKFRAFALVDTGADECALPGDFASILGHDLEKGKPKKIRTGSGWTTAFMHTTQIGIFAPNTDKIIYTTDEALLDFMPNLTRTALLGYKSFLSKCLLEINYPKKLFTIQTL